MKRHVLLIGLPGAGKTSIGRLAASQLAAPFHDGDGLVESEAGKSISRIFSEDGEAVFRRLERDAVARALAGEPAVIAPGGGWAAHPGNLRAAHGALTVHLEVSPETAARRLGQIHGRPLLGDDPASVLTALAVARLPLYRQAEVAVMTDGVSESDVTDRVVQLARLQGGW